MAAPWNEPVGVGAPESPTSVRYEVMAATAVMSLLLYLDRFCISMAVPLLSAEFELTTMEMGLVFSAFFLSYALAQVPAGWLGERLGARVMLSGCVLVWSLMTGLMGLVSSLWQLLIVRLLLGVSQAGAYPIAARINSLWVPYPQRALANGLVTMGGRLGGALAPSLTGALILFFNDEWRPAFWIYGGLGIAWAVYFALYYRNHPDAQPRCNTAEVDLIRNSLPGDASDPRGKGQRLPWGIALRSVSLWLQCLLQVTSNIAWLFLGTWLPTYLQETYKLGIGATGTLSSLPLLAGMFGCLLGGIASDRLVRRLGIRWGRNVLGIGSKVGAGFFMLLSVPAADAMTATAMLVIAAFINDLGLSATWAYFQDAGGSYVGPLLGFANMFGNLGATASPLLLARVRDDFGWGAALYTCAGLFVFSGICWIWMDGRVPIVPPERQYAD
ncbi:MAG: MFS transporter [Gemmataceae bacterium]|nr:MFS transporter [Gemmataceae bacterium]